MNTLWVARNHAAPGSGVSLKAPLPAEDPNYPSSNILDPDRYLVHSYPSTAGADCDYFLDIGPNRPTDIVGLLGFVQGPPLAFFPNLMTVRRGSVYPEDGSWVDVTGFTLGQVLRDPYYMLPSPLVSRYWKVTLSPTFQGFSLGNVLLGQTIDLGVSYSPGSTETLVRQRVSNPSVMGARMLTTTGPNRRRFAMNFAAIPGSLRSTLLQMAATSPLTIVHPTYGLCQVELADDTLAVSHRFGDTYDAALEVEQLP